MKSAIDTPDVAPGFTAVELLIPTWCTCWDKQSIIHDNFMVIKYFEYTSKFSHDIFPSTSNFMAIYFTLTGLHGLHILGGVIVMLYFYLPISHKLWEEQPEHFTNRIEALGLYWHFVDLVWIFLFPVLYLL